MFLAATRVSSENSEVFRKETLASKGNTDEKRGKQKRRENRVSKTKCKRTKACGDVLTQIKSKENTVAPNDSTQRITMSKDQGASLFTQKVGIYNKGKSSIMVSRRRPLHGIQFSQKTLKETKKDLKRVLGYSGDENSPTKSFPRSSKHSPMATGGQQAEEPKHSSSEMEQSPPPEKVDSSYCLLAIARSIAKGLHPNMVYSDSDYLNNAKAELRKLLKQGSAPLSTAAMDTVPVQNEDPATNVFQLPPTDTAASSSDTFSLSLFEEQDKSDRSSIPTANSDYHLLMLQSAMLQSAMFKSASEPSPVSTEMVQPFDLTEIELTTSAYNPSYPPAHSSVEDAGSAFEVGAPLSLQTDADPPRDFLDLLDTMQHQQQGVSGERPQSMCRPPSSKWMPTPERPPMFPQKLY